MSDAAELRKILPRYDELNPAFEEVKAAVDQIDFGLIGGRPVDMDMVHRIIKAFPKVVDYVEELEGELMDGASWASEEIDGVISEMKKASAQIDSLAEDLRIIHQGKL